MRRRYVFQESYDLEIQDILTNQQKCDSSYFSGFFFVLICALKGCFYCCRYCLKGTVIIFVLSYSMHTFLFSFPFLYMQSSFKFFCLKKTFFPPPCVGHVIRIYTPVEKNCLSVALNQDNCLKSIEMIIEKFPGVKCPFHSILYMNSIPTFRTIY